MIILKETDKLQILLGGNVATNQLDFVASWRDITTTAYTAGKSVSYSNNTTAVDFIAAPAASTQRVIDHINVFNKDTASSTVTIRYNDGTNNYILWSGVMLSGSVLTYSEGKGWELINTLTSVGYAINVQALTSSPTDAQTVYFGTLPKAPTTTAAISKVEVRKAGTLKIAEIYCYSGTAGSNESWSLYIRVNNNTDYLIATLAVSASERIFSNTGLSIPLGVGDYFEIKSVQPTWGTNPLTTIYGGYVYIE